MNDCVHGASTPILTPPQPPLWSSGRTKNQWQWKIIIRLEILPLGSGTGGGRGSEEENKLTGRKQRFFFYGICANKVPKLHCKHEPPENIWSECPSTVLRRQRVGTNADMQNSYWLLQRGSVPLLCFTLVNTYSTLRYTHLSLKQKYRYSQYWFMLWCKHTYWNAEWNRWNNKWYCRNKNS